MFYYCGINYLATIEMRYEENVALIFEHTLQFLFSSLELAFSSPTNDVWNNLFPSIVSCIYK